MIVERRVETSLTTVFVLSLLQEYVYRNILAASVTSKATSYAFEECVCVQVGGNTIYIYKESSFIFINHCLLSQEITANKTQVGSFTRRCQESDFKRRTPKYYLTYCDEHRHRFSHIVYNIANVQVHTYARRNRLCDFIDDM